MRRPQTYTPAFHEALKGLTTMQATAVVAAVYAFTPEAEPDVIYTPAQRRLFLAQRRRLTRKAKR